MIGYWDEPEKTAEAIDDDGWMHTGDLAVMREDGYCNIVGRIKDMVIRGGENIYPREIEEFLYTHPDIEDVQVIGVPDERYGEELCAWVKMRAGAEPLDADAVREFATGRLSHYKIPRYVMVVEEFPMTVTGKIRKVADARGVRAAARPRLSARDHSTGPHDRGPVSDDIDRLADDYHDRLLRHRPDVGAHDRRVPLRRPLRRDRSRGRGGRAAAGGARASPRGPRRSTEERSTSSSGSPARWSPGTRLVARPGCSRRARRSSPPNPIFGVAGRASAIYVPKLAVPDAEVAEAMVGKFEGVAPLLPRPRRPAPRGRRVRPHPGRLRGAADRRAARRAGWPRRSTEDPMLAVQDPPGRRRRRPVARAAARGRAEAGAAGGRALPRRAARRGGCRAPGPTSGAA